MNLVLLVIILIYAGVFLSLCLGFICLKKPPPGHADMPPVSVVIAARNERSTIIACLRSLVTQDYKGKTELIVIDDASTDNTYQAAKEFLENTTCEYRLLQNETRLGKKNSLQRAIETSRSGIIVTRDADTFTASSQWLANLVNSLRSANAAMVVAPVTIQRAKNLLAVFEWAENAVLTVVTGGSHFFGAGFLASGANLAFTKAAFLRVKGYSSHQHLESGDDVLLLRDLKKAGETIRYLKDELAVVTTYPAQSFSELLHQKIRWSKKVFQSPALLPLGLALLVTAGNLLWIFCVASLFIQPLNPVHLTVILVKFFTDSLLVFSAARFFKKLHMLWLVIPVSIVYPVYSLIVATGALLIKPRWK